MSEPVIVLDAGVLDRATTNHEFRWTLRELTDGGWTPVIPTVVLAEAITGRPEDAPVNHAVSRIGTAETGEATARLAGRLRYSVKRSGERKAPSGIDAIVAAHAAEAGRGVVFTTDLPDLERLLSDTPSIAVRKP